MLKMDRNTPEYLRYFTGILAGVQIYGNPVIGGHKEKGNYVGIRMVPTVVGSQTNGPDIIPGLDPAISSHLQLYKKSNK